VQVVLYAVELCGVVVDGVVDAVDRVVEAVDRVVDAVDRVVEVGQLLWNVCEAVDRVVEAVDRVVEAVDRVVEAVDRVVEVGQLLWNVCEAVELLLHVCQDLGDDCNLLLKRGVGASRTTVASATRNVKRCLSRRKSARVGSVVDVGLEKCVERPIARGQEKFKKTLTY